MPLGKGRRMADIPGTWAQGHTAWLPGDHPAILPLGVPRHRLRCPDPAAVRAADASPGLRRDGTRDRQGTPSGSSAVPGEPPSRGGRAPPAPGDPSMLSDGGSSMIEYGVMSVPGRGPGPPRTGACPGDADPSSRRSRPPTRERKSSTSPRWALESERERPHGHSVQRRFFVLHHW
jgi:hypothetical protein